ncbi:MAG: hypothetical protein FGM14_15380 [Flavobacteriales bacterium]|nr:hypothetical protein [Flavobacteriales bacterium]
MKTLSISGFRKFIPIGNEVNPSEFLSKITLESQQKPESFWATLGWSDNQPFGFNGELEFSENGNLLSRGITGKIVNELKSINDDPNVVIVERFINLDHAAIDQQKKFRFNKKKKLRLTLFLNPEEAALVYIQHSLKENYNDDDADIEFIQPEKTDKYFTTNRDRLHYYFDVIPKNELKQTTPNNKKFEQSEITNDSSFILKILTFTRGTGSGKELYEKAISKINKQDIYDNVEHQIGNLVGKKKYNLLKFNPNGNDLENPEFRGAFESIDSFSNLNSDAKTLFLIHGTLASTNTTFKHFLTEKSNGRSFLQHLLDTKQYEQIIAFDHPTISHDVNQNIEYLLAKYLTSAQFSQTHIDIIACSRGCVFAEALSNDTRLNGILSFNKIMLFSAANGVNYFRFAKNIPKFLSMWQKTASGPFLKVILTLAQFSGEFFLQMPGCEQMTPNHPKLKAILEREPLNSNTKFISATSDWTLDNARGHVFKRSGAFLLDRTISLILGNEHDWVVGVESQLLLPNNSNRVKRIELDSMHCKYLDESYTLPSNVHEIIITALA